MNKINNMNKIKLTYGASVFDFDETVGYSDNVVYARKDNVTIYIPSDEWPNVGEKYKEDGWELDFDDFNKVTNGTIIGLGDSTGEAKAKWIQENLITAGVNDIYFVDDAFSNVKAVKEMFEEYPKGFLIKGGKSIITK